MISQTGLDMKHASRFRCRSDVEHSSMSKVCEGDQDRPMTNVCVWDVTAGAEQQEAASALALQIVYAEL